MPPIGLQIYLRLCVTLIFDLLTQELTVSWPCPVDHLCQLTFKSAHSFSKHCVHKFDNIERTNESVGGRKNQKRCKYKIFFYNVSGKKGQVENIRTPPASLAWWWDENPVLSRPKSQPTQSSGASLPPPSVNHFVSLFAAKMPDSVHFKVSVINHISPPYVSLPQQHPFTHAA